MAHFKCPSKIVRRRRRGSGRAARGSPEAGGDTGAEEAGGDTGAEEAEEAGGDTGAEEAEEAEGDTGAEEAEEAGGDTGADIIDWNNVIYTTFLKKNHFQGGDYQTYQM